MVEARKKGLQKNAVSVLDVNEVWRKGQGEIRRGDYAVFYSGGESAERWVAVVVHENVVRSVVEKIVFNGRITAFQLKAELVIFI